MKQPLLLIWAFAATVAAVVSTGTAVVLFTRSQRRALQAQQIPVTTPSTPFAALSEADIPGRYRWMGGQTQNHFITLNQDHSFSYDKESLPIYRWELLPEGLFLFWRRGSKASRFTHLEGPGVFISPREGTNMVTMKLVE
jgi:hypothetical protein